jgi:hypothetical protein
MENQALYDTVIEQIKNKPVDEWLSRFTSIVRGLNTNIVDAFLRDHDRLYRIMFDACLNETLRQIYRDCFASEAVKGDNVWLLKALNPKVFGAVGSYVEKIESVKQWQAYTKAIVAKLGGARVGGYREAFDVLYGKIYGILITAFQTSLREQLGATTYINLEEKNVSELPDQFIQKIKQQWFTPIVAVEPVENNVATEEEHIYDIVTDQIKTRPIEEWKEFFVKLLKQLEKGDNFIKGFLKDYDERHNIKSVDYDKNLTFEENIKEREKSLILVFQKQIRKQLLGLNYNTLKGSIPRDDDLILIYSQSLKELEEEIRKYDIFYTPEKYLADKPLEFSIENINIKDLEESEYTQKIINFFKNEIQKRRKESPNYKYDYDGFRKYLLKDPEFEKKEVLLQVLFKMSEKKKKEELITEDFVYSRDYDIGELARLTVENVRINRELLAYKTLVEQLRLQKDTTFSEIKISESKLKLTLEELKLVKIENETMKEKLEELKKSNIDTLAKSELYKIENDRLNELNQELESDKNALKKRVEQLTATVDGKSEESEEEEEDDDNENYFSFWKIYPTDDFDASSSFEEIPDF